MLSHVPSHDLEFYHLLIFTSRYPLELTLSMGHFSLTFLDCVFSNVSSNFLPEKRHSHIGCICLALLHCAFSNVSSNYLLVRMHNHTGYICLSFPHCAFSNVSSNCLLVMMQSHMFGVSPL